MNRIFFKLSFLFTFTLFILRGSVVAQDVVKLSLEDAISYAMKNANSLKTAQNGIQDAELLIKENLATGLPQVNAELGYNYYFLAPQSLLPDFISPATYGVLVKEGVRNGSNQTITFPAGLGNNFSKVSFVQKNSLTGSVSVSQLIYSGSYNVALRAVRLARDLAKMQVRSKEADIRNQVIEAYLPALLITESVKTLDKNIANLQKLLKDVTATYKAGFIEQLDVDRLSLSLANLQSDRDNLDRQKGLVLNALKLVMGYPMETDIILSDDINALTKDAEMEDLTGAIDFSKRPEYALLQGVESINKLQIDLVKASVYPTVAGFASLSESLQANNYFKDKWNSLPTGVVGVTAKINIWDSGQRKAKIERAQLVLKNQQNQKADFERVVTLQVLNARISYQNAQKRLESQRKTAILAERIYETTQTKYKNGVGSSLEISTAEQQLYAAQQNVRQAQYDLMVVQKQLQKALGK